MIWVWTGIGALVVVAIVLTLAIARRKKRQAERATEALLEKGLTSSAPSTTRTSPM